jgi:hypothetical protein
MAWSIPASMSLAAITGVLLVGDIARVPRCLQRQMWSDGDSGNLYFPPQPLSLERRKEYGSNQVMDMPGEKQSRHA